MSDDAATASGRVFPRWSCRDCAITGDVSTLLRHEAQTGHAASPPEPGRGLTPATDDQGRVIHDPAGSVAGGWLPRAEGRVSSCPCCDWPTPTGACGRCWNGDCVGGKDEVRHVAAARRRSGRSPLYVNGQVVPDAERFVHLDGSECVAGYVGETMECASGGGVVVRMDAFDALTAVSGV